MKKSSFITLIIIIVIIALFIAWFAYQSNSAPNNAAVYPPPAPANTGTPGTPSSTTAFTQSISDGTVTVSYPSTDFGLATNQQQILVKSNIPPCSTGFNYCLYYIGKAYQGTNFESAGLRIQKRTDLTTQAKCLTTQPSGFTGQAPITASSSGYAVSVFPQVGGGAAGNSSNGSLYRLSYNGSCYEFETSVGQSQFANYPSGTIQQFTASDQAAIQSELQQILGTLTLSSGATVSFPQH